ncbi:MAG TPA: NlpC/P60 family protein [Pseudonocardia sp.]|uniref:C40 family peptidase n=1 Tax=Pseudonocardia sp. TaxID=60912 RepID=UPI002F411EF5
MSTHRARHGASSGGRSVSETLARAASGPGGVATIAPGRSAFALAAAAAAGAGAAAATVTGTFPAIQLPGLDDSRSVAHIVGSTEAAASLAAPDSAPVDARRVSALSAPGVGGGTVMATDLHHANANEIAALSRTTGLDRRTQSALSLPSRIGGVPIAGPAGSRSAALALRYAATRLGMPYVWGANGPYAFDCSGLMQWAYWQLGILLPRTSGEQSQVGNPVALKDLRPGDMVFYYTPVSHVGMYLGNGMVLHASEPGKPVKISPVNSFPIHNARRVTT